MKKILVFIVLLIYTSLFIYGEEVNKKITGNEIKIKNSVFDDYSKNKNELLEIKNYYFIIDYQENIIVVQLFRNPPSNPKIKRMGGGAEYYLDYDFNILYYNLIK